MKRCKIILRALMIALVVVMFAGPAMAQGMKGYPKMCTKNPTVANPGPSEYVTCEQQRAGTGMGTPGYVRLQDGNGVNLADVETFNAIVAGIALTQRAVMSAAMALGYDPATTLMEYVWAIRPNDAVSTSARGLVTVGLNMLYTTAGWRRDRAEQGNSDAVANTTWAPYRLNLNLYQDEGLWRRWTGGRLNSDSLEDDERGPNVRSFLFGYNLPDGDFDRLHSGWFPANFGVTSNGLKVMSGNYFWDIDNGFFIRDQGADPDTDAVPTTQAAPYRLTLGHIYSTDGGVFTRDMGETADGGVIASTRTAAYRFSLDYAWNGSGWSPVDAVVTHADGLALSLNGKVSASFMYGYTGATMDLVRMTANKGLQVGIESYPPSEDFGNARKSFFKKDTAVIAPSGQVTATIGTAAVTCLTGRYVQSDINWCVTVENTDGADSMTDVDVEQSPDGAAPWGDLGWTTCDTLAAGLTCVKCFSGSAYAYIRGRCSAADANQTSSIVTYTANKN